MPKKHPEQADPDSEAARLEGVLAQLESEFEESRCRYLRAIDALRGGETLPQKSVLRKQRPTSRTDAPKSAVQGSGSEEATGGKGVPSLSRAEVVDAAIDSFSGPFNAPQLREWVAEHHPKHVEGILGSYLPTALAAREKAGKIKCIKEGTKGMPHTWVKI